MSHGLQSHVAVFGDLSHLYSDPLSHYFDNLVIGTHRLSAQLASRMECIVLAHQIPHRTSRQAWYRKSNQDREELERLLPTMDNPSTILVIGHTTLERSYDQHGARRFLHQLISGMSSRARNFYGKEVSANGLELPPSADHHVTTRRLIRFLYGPPLAADNNVICYENIRNQSLNMALTAFEL